MYDDYPVIYESTVNQFIIFYIVAGVILLILLLFTFFSLSKVFKKANRSGISAWIPIYNIIALLEMTNLSKFLVLIFILFLPAPAVIYFLNINNNLKNIIPIILEIPPLLVILNINLKLAKMFKKNKIFGLGMTFLPFIFIPVLGFSDSEYMGINIVAMEGKTTITDVPDVDLNRNKKIEIEVNDQVDTQLKGMNISLGGGVYQKTYSSNLLGVDNNNVIVNNQKKEQKQPVYTPGQPVQRKSEPNNGLFSVNFIETNPSQQQPVQTQPQQVQVNQDMIIKQEQVVEQPQQNLYNIQEKPNHIPVSPESEFKTCPNCGAKIKANNTTCFICGGKV